MTMDLEPSEEFPILYGLLTERKKGTPRTPTQTFQNPFRRRITLVPNIAEPDSSTPDDLGQTSSTGHDKAGIPKHEGSESGQGQGQLSTTTSPLLILRLSSTEATNRRYSNSRNRKQTSCSSHEYQVIQQRPPIRNSSSKVISEDDDCAPSSTTSDHEEVPMKRSRSNSTNSTLPSTRTSNGELPHFEPMVSTTSPSTVSRPLTTASPNVIGHEDNSAQGDDSNTSNSSGSSNSSSVFYNPEARSYNCNYCDLKFKRQFHLLRHVASHEEKREVCCHCNTAFYRKDNLLVHQSKCQQREGQGQRAMRPTPIFRAARPPPRTLADLLDRDYDAERDCDGHPLNNNSLIHLPSGLEISEVPNEAEVPLPTPPLPPLRRRLTEKMDSFGESEEEVELNEDSVVEIFPCGHCREVFETFSRLLKHTASRHIKNPTDGTFHFEIETVLHE